MNPRPSREESMARFMRGASRVADFRRDKSYSVADRFAERVADSGGTPFLVFEDRSITFAEADRWTNRVAQAALAAGIGQGDVIGLMMHNRPEFILTWLGLAKAGIVTALINTSATGRVLAHALDQVGARALIVGAELVEALDTLDAPLTIPVWEQAETSAEASGRAGIVSFNAMMDAAGDAAVPADARAGIVMADPLYLIFTSGTTGLPKAAKMSHMRFLNSGEMMCGLMGIDKSGVLYCILPLYHGAGGMVLPSMALAEGVPLVLRRKFSRSEFWNDVRRHKITAMYYIGEILRYLLANEPRADDRDHTLRHIAGAGLKPELWTTFVERFGIENVIEGLGSTEANYGISNVDNEVGSVGRVPYPEYSNIRVALWDNENEGHVLGADGKPVLARAGQVGELIAEVLYGNDGAGFFEGYTSSEATEAKLLRNVFREGDVWFRSGDLVRFDEDDYYYFVDRVGDTYRWKSENVSTQEVEAVLASFPGPETINIYGVRIPGTEGRAGMASINYPEGNYPEGGQFDPKAFHDYAEARLASYAMPLFVRISPDADMTTTFKLKKRALQQEGYDPARVNGDPLWLLDPAAKTYVPLTEESLVRLGIAPFKAEEA